MTMGGRGLAVLQGVALQNRPGGGEAAEMRALARGPRPFGTKDESHWTTCIFVFLKPRIACPMSLK